MNNVIVKSGTVFCLMFRFLCTDCLASDSLSVRFWMKEGERLMADGQFRKAGVYFEKGFFLSQNPEEMARLLMKKSDCLFSEESYSSASRVLSRIPYEGIKDSTAVQARQKAALAAYLNGDFSVAESHLVQAIALIEDSNLTFHLLPFQAMVLNEQQRWEESGLVLCKFISRLRISDMEKELMLEDVKSMYNTKTIPRLKDPERAKRLSMIIPGLGYAYAGAWSEGIWNVALQGLGLGLTGVGFLYRYYFTSAFVSITIFQKFYSGGINRSAYHTKKWNSEKTRAFNQKAKGYILRLMEKEKAP